VNQIIKLNRSLLWVSTMHMFQLAYQPFVEIMVKIDSYTDSIAIRHYVYHLV